MMSGRCAQTSLVSLRRGLADRGFDLTLDDDSLVGIRGLGYRGDTMPLALVAAQILLREKPITLRGLMYRVVSAGFLPDTSRSSYSKIGRLMVRMREAGLIPFSWIVDGIRSTIKPSSWSGINDFADTVRDAYRMDFWARLPEYCHIIVEKDAIAGTLAPVTREYDVPLSPIRGYSSLSFANEIAETWNRIEKPIFCYYLGDYDASGFDLQRDIREKLERYCHKEFRFVRLGVSREDFDEFDLLPLAVKESDTRSAKFVMEHGTRCAELDALPSTELRRRIRTAIESHIPSGEWERLKEHERIERESFQQVMAQLAC